MDNYLQSQHLSFKAKPGKNMLKMVSREFNGNQSRIDKFKDLFEKVHEEYTNANTIIDINSKGNYIYSHTSFPNIKYCHNVKSHGNSSFPERLINECSKVIATGESSFFKSIIAKLVKKGVSISDLRMKAENENLGKSFSNLLDVAERILKENPKSKLTNQEFDFMDMKISEEKINNTNGGILDIIKELNMKN